MEWIPADWGVSNGPLWAAGTLIAILTTLVVMPSAIAKLRGAGMVGHDIHKVGRPPVAEMGGLGFFSGFMTGALVLLVVLDLPDEQALAAFAGLLTVAGAAIVGILDDFIALRQRFKAGLPLAFAIPLALFLPDTTVWLPFAGTVQFSYLYPLVLVPIGIACASNGVNMLEGWNGLGAGLTCITAMALSALAILRGQFLGLVILLPLAGAAFGFLLFNFYPAKVFPGDAGTLSFGAALAAGAMLSKLEFAGALMFLPFIVEFFVKGVNGFPSRGTGGELRDGVLYCPPHRPRGLGQVLLKVTGGVSERTLVLIFYGLQAVLCSLVVIGFQAWA